MIEVQGHVTGVPTRVPLEDNSGLWVMIDAEGIIQHVSGAVEKLLGFRANELVGTRYHDLVVGQQNLENSQEMFRALLNGQEVDTYIREYRHKRGTPVLLEACTSPLWREGRVAGVHARVRPVADRRRPCHAIIQVDGQTVEELKGRCGIFHVIRERLYGSDTCIGRYTVEIICTVDAAGELEVLTANLKDEEPVYSRFSSWWSQLRKPVMAVLVMIAFVHLLQAVSEVGKRLV